MQQLVNDIQWFLKSKAWYDNMGVPYRRGYLLHGEPGCGKSSLVFALAGHFNVPVCCVDLSSKDMDDMSLLRVFSSAPMPSFLLIEEVDVAFVPVGTGKSQYVLLFASQPCASMRCE